MQLVERVTGRLRCWTTWYLSYAGRAQLVQSILQSLHVYWSLAFLLPKSVVTEIDKLCRKFLWGGTTERTRPALVGWDTVCLPRRFGGLGLKNQELWIVAVIGKQVWVIANKADILWVKWVAIVYMKNHDFFDIQVTQNMSWHWKQILKTRDLLRLGYQNGAWTSSTDG